MKLTLLGLFCFFALSGFAQTITYGPIVGGVTDTSCNIFIGTSAPTSFSVLLSKTNPFGSIAASGVGTTGPSDSTAIIHIGGLIPNTQYYMRATINGVPISTPAKFSTLLAPDSVGHQVFLTGACIDGLTDADSAIFNRAAAENAKAFIQLGNWGYPDAVEGCQDIYLSNPPTSWAATYGNVQSIYKQRYSGNSISFIQSLGLDYVYDDHDYMNEKTGGQEILGYVINPFIGIVGSPYTYSQPAAARLNSLQGYRQYFPSYLLHDSADGLYHSFKSGNAEFFVLDTRTPRGPVLLCVDTVGGTSNWYYKQDPSTHMLGNEQMLWLTNALSQSTATWKFIVSSVPFNMGMRFALDTLIKIGGGDVPFWNPKLACDPLGLGTHAYSSTNHFADMWAGFKADGDSLLNYVLSNNIPNVFVVSGNTGTVGLDDGANSGLPELMSANMKITNSEDALFYQNFMGFNTWDLGGSGLCQQQNLNSTYGRIEIYNNDSIRLSAVDETGAEVAGANFYAGSAYKYNQNYSPLRIPLATADVRSMNENDSLVSINVLANDSDYNGYPLYVNLQANPGHGAAAVNGNNTITYIPDTGFYGVDTFYYTACDHTNPVCGNCASAMVTIHVNKVSGINASPEAFRFSIYPNPADDILFLAAAGSTETLKFELVNSVGQSLQQVSFTGNITVDISKYAGGNYFYKLQDKDNQLLKVGKIVVVR